MRPPSNKALKLPAPRGRPSTQSKGMAASALALRRAPAPQLSAGLSGQ